MIFLAWIVRGLSVLLLCAGVSGCLPSVHGDEEEEKEAHYLAGKSCLSTMDYAGAVESFEKAVEVNPRSASAHFQLGCLYEERQRESASAIYHYEQFLKLRPESDKVGFVRDRINNCKQDLAKTVMPLPIPAGMQREFEQLAEDNKRLREDNERLRTQLAVRAQLVATNPAIADNPPPESIATAGRATPPSEARRATSGRTHVVQPGETLTGISRKYGVKLDDLMRANPGLDARRMRVGRALTIPSN